MTKDGKEDYTFSGQGGFGQLQQQRDEKDKDKDDKIDQEKTTEGKDAKAAKPKPYPLKTCVVSDEKISGGDMEPYTWVYKGQEIKMCCKDCKKDFDKDPAKYMKKIEAAAAKKAK